MIAFEFPYPPSVNHYWGQRGNMRYVTKQGREFRENVAGKVSEIAQETITHEIHAFVCL